MDGGQGPCVLSPEHVGIRPGKDIEIVSCEVYGVEGEREAKHAREAVEEMGTAGGEEPEEEERNRDDVFEAAQRVNSEDVGEFRKKMRQQGVEEYCEEWRASARQLIEDQWGE